MKRIIWLIIILMVVIKPFDVKGKLLTGELAEKLANRRQKVQQQIEDDFDAPDLAIEPAEEAEVVEDSASSELKTDLEDELRSAFSKLKG